MREGMPLQNYMFSMRWPAFVSAGRQFGGDDTINTSRSSSDILSGVSISTPLPSSPSAAASQRAGTQLLKAQDLAEELLQYFNGQQQNVPTFPSALVLKLIDAVLALNPRPSIEERHGETVPHVPQAKRQRSNTAGVSRARPGDDRRSTLLNVTSDVEEEYPLPLHAEDGFDFRGGSDLSETGKYDSNKEVTEVFSYLHSLCAAFISDYQCRKSFPNRIQQLFNADAMLMQRKGHVKDLALVGNGDLYAPSPADAMPLAQIHSRIWDGLLGNQLSLFDRAPALQHGFLRMQTPAISIPWIWLEF
jgi:hypothetical protein